jgi:hypothetical protein
MDSLVQTNQKNLIDSATSTLSSQTIEQILIDHPIKWMLSSQEVKNKHD